MKPLTIITIAIAACLNINAASKGIKYIPGDSLTMINKAQPGGPFYKRIDVDKYPTLTPTVNRYYSFPTGLALVFRTDSRNINAKWKTTSDYHAVNGPALMQSGLDLYIKKDGRWVWAGCGKPKFNKKKHSSPVIHNMADSVKECMLYLPLFERLDSLEIGIDADAMIEPIANPFNKRVVAIGSSITHGSGTSRPGMAYPARMERATGIEFINLGASGQCKLDDFFAQIAADTKADAFIFDTFSNPSGQQIDERLESFVKTVRKAHPKTPLIFIQTLDRPTTTFNSKVREFEQGKQVAARRGLKKIMAKDKNVYFIDPGMPIGDDYEGTVDGVHPTDLGHERIIATILPQIKEILRQHKVIK